MRQLNRISLAIIAAVSLIWLPLVASFFTTTTHGLRVTPTHPMHWKTRHQCQRRIHLFAEDPTREVSKLSSRRGFISHCAAAAAAYGAVVVSPSPANSMPQSAKEENANQYIIQSITTDHDKTSIDKNYLSSPQTLAAKSEYTPTAFQESISGFVSGSAVSTVKTLVKYPLDTATVRLQMPNTPYTLGNLPALFSGSFDGITAPLLSNIPAGAIFFAVKDATKSSLKESGFGLPKWALTSLAVGAALPPYWLLRNPSEVIKTRLQVGAEGYTEGTSTLEAFQMALGSKNSTMDGVAELYQGYTENLLYGFPADIIKFVAYDYLTGGKGKKGVPPLEGAMKGALSTALAQLVTTPLDVLRNRIMAEVNASDGDRSKDKDLSYIDRLAKIAKEEGVDGLFAGSSPRVAKAMLSGAIQFATYEETKQKMAQFFMNR